MEDIASEPSGPFFISDEEENKYLENKRIEELKKYQEVIQYPKVAKVKKLPFKWTLAINLFDKVYALRELNQIELQHETIHSIQMKKLGYIKFYIKYICEWIKNYRKYKDWYSAYRNISFEKEAYTYENDIEYIIKIATK